MVSLLGVCRTIAALTRRVEALYSFRFLKIALPKYVPPFFLAGWCLEVEPTNSGGDKKNDTPPELKEAQECGILPAPFAPVRHDGA